MLYLLCEIHSPAEPLVSPHGLTSDPPEKQMTSGEPILVSIIKVLVIWWLFYVYVVAGLCKRDYSINNIAKDVRNGPANAFISHDSSNNNKTTAELMQQRKSATTVIIWIIIASKQWLQWHQLARLTVIRQPHWSQETYVYIVHYDIKTVMADNVSDKR